MFKKNKNKKVETEELFEEELFAKPEPQLHPRDKKQRFSDEPSYEEDIPNKLPKKNGLLYRKEDFEEEPDTKPEPLFQKEEQPKADISEYFQGKQSKKLKRKTTKPERFDDSKLSKKERKRQLEMDLYEGRALKFKDQIFRDIPQLLEYLRKNYLRIDKIAKELVEQQQFHQWLKTHSDQYDASIVEYEEIIAKIENK